MARDRTITVIFSQIIRCQLQMTQELLVGFIPFKGFFANLENREE